MKKAFTLIELLGVIILLAIIAIVVYPIVDKVIQNSRNEAYLRSVENLENAARTYGTINNLGYSSEQKKLLISDLKKAGLIKDENIKNPKTNEELKGCILYHWDNSKNQYKYEYSEECEMSANTFNLTYGGSDYDSFFSVITTSDGYVVVGDSYSTDGDLTGLNKGDYDAIIVKYDLNGNIVWKKNYGGSSDERFSNVITISNSYIAVGQSYSTDGDLTGLNKGKYDAIIVKYDLNGNVVWKKNYGGSDSENFSSVIATSDGYIAVGYSHSTNGDLSGLNKGDYDAIIVKYDLNGNIVWKKNYGGSSDERFSNVITISNGYIAVGNSWSTDGDLIGLNKGDDDAIIVKYDLNGNVVWKKNYGGSNEDYFSSVIATSDGYIAVGNSWSTNGDLIGLNKGNQDAIIVKYDLNGNVVWKKNYGGSYHDYFSNVIATSDGYIAAGTSPSVDGDLTGLNKGDYDAIIVKYDLNGNVVWKKNYGGNYWEQFFSIRPISDGYIAVGSSESTDGDLTGLNKGDNDAIIIKYDLNGEF